MRAPFVVAVAALALACPPRSTAEAPDAGPGLTTAKVTTSDGAAALPACADVPAKDGGGASEVEPAPPPTSEELTRRMKHLVEAIAQNDVALAADVFYPRDAYIETFDVRTPDPGKHYDTKVKGAIAKQVAAVHRRTRGVAGAQLKSFDLGAQISRVEPKARAMRVPTWRARHAKLTYLANGETHQLDIAELVAWRGAWYVTRLR